MQGLGTGDESPNRGSLNLFLEKGLKGRKRIGKNSGRPIEALKNHLVGFLVRQSFSADLRWRMINAREVS